MDQKLCTVSFPALLELHTLPEQDFKEKCVHKNLPKGFEVLTLDAFIKAELRRAKSRMAKSFAELSELKGKGVVSKKATFGLPAKSWKLKSTQFFKKLPSD
jgi:hypothetical protein